MISQVKPLRILCYHIIDEYKDNPVDYLRIPFELFKNQIDWLLNTGWTGITLEDYMHKYEKDLVNKKLFLVTFDDAYKNEDTIRAYKYLDNLKIPFTVFATDQVFNNWDKDIWEKDWINDYTDKYPLYSYSELRSVSKSFKYMSLHYHSKDHADLVKVTSFKVKNHVDPSSITDTTHFCIPYGSYDDHTISELVSLGYKNIYTLNDGTYTRHSDNYRINRLFVSGGRSLLDFKMKVILGFNLRYQLKKFFKLKNLYKKVK